MGRKQPRWNIVVLRAECRISRSLAIIRAETLIEMHTLERCNPIGWPRVDMLIIRRKLSRTHYFCGQRVGTWQRMLLECDRHLWKFDGFCVLSILYFDSFEIQRCQVIGLFISVVFLNCEFPDCFIFFRRKSSPCFHSRSGSLWRCFGTAKHGTAWSWNKRCWFQV